MRTLKEGQAMRDITKRHYETALIHHGMMRRMMGYIEVLPGYEVNEANGGSTRRDRLAYLLKMQAKGKP